MMRRLLIRPGAIGDFITSLPAMESLRGNYTEVWCAAQNVSLARFADRAISIAASGLDRLGFLDASDVVERLKTFDDIVSWYGANLEEFRMHISNLSLPFRFCRALPEGRHAVDFYNAQAKALGGSGASRFPRIAVPPAVQTEVRTFAAIHPFASSDAKRAPLAWFESAVSKLQDAMPVRWLAGPEESLPKHLQEETVRFENLYDLACWLRGARIYVGNDSGISHLAAAVGTPTLSVFLKTEERVWMPRGLTWSVRGK